MDEQVRQRRLRRLLRVTFPDGKVLCYKSVTMTFVEALQMIETDRLPEVKLESYHLHSYLRRFIHCSRRLSWAPRYVVCFRCNTLDTCPNDYDHYLLRYVKSKYSINYRYIKIDVNCYE